MIVAGPAKRTPKKQIKNQSALLRIQKSNNPCKKTLTPLFKHSPAIKAAYRLARELTHIYNAHHRKATAKEK